MERRNYDDEKAIKELSEAIELFPKENNDRYVEFVNKCIEVYYDNKEFDNASKLSEHNLNLAIESQNINLIESFLKKGQTV